MSIPDIETQDDFRASHSNASADPKKGSVPKVAVLHLMNEVAESSISSIVRDQIQLFESDRFEWHIGGLRGIDSGHPFDQGDVRVVDFSQASSRSELQKQVRQYVRDHGIQIVHTHTPRSTVIGTLALGMRRSAKLVATKHLHAVSGERHSWGWAFSLVDRVAIYFPDRIVAVSNDVGRKIQGLPGIPADRVRVIQNAVHSDAFYVPQEREPCREELGIPLDVPVLGFAGRLAKQKRLDLLLEAFAVILKHHSDCRLLLAGEGEDREQLEELADELGVSSQVIWAGFRRDVPRLLAASDIYVQSSVNEGLSLSLLQAMAAEVAIVATDVGGTREIVNDDTGILVKPGASSVIADGVLRLLNDRQERIRIVRNAKQLVEEDFGVRRQMDGYLDVYKQVLSVTK